MHQWLKIKERERGKGERVKWRQIFVPPNFTSLAVMKQVWPRRGCGIPDLCIPSIDLPPFFFIRFTFYVLLFVCFLPPIFLQYVFLYLQFLSFNFIAFLKLPFFFFLLSIRLFLMSIFYVFCLCSLPLTILYLLAIFTF